MINKIKKVLVWPIIFIIGQAFIELLFIIKFSLNIKGTMTNEEFLNYINKVDFQERLNNYINSKLIIISLIVALIFIPIFYNIYKKYKFNNKFYYKNIIIPIILGVTISLVYNISVFNLNNLLNTTYLYYETSIPLIFQIIYSGLLGPIIEELLFRGIVYNRLKEVTTPMRAVVFCSILFGIIHLNIINAIYAFGVSFIALYLYEKYKTIKAPIIMHMTLNLTTILMIPLIIKNYVIFNTYLLVVSVILLLVMRLKIKEYM